MKATIARIKAAELLGFSGDNHYLSQAWPKLLSSKVIIELQGNNEISFDLIKVAIDGGIIHKHYEETDFMACLNPAIAACDFIALLKEIGKEPSESIKAWYESTTPQTEAVGGIGAGNHAGREPKQGNVKHANASRTSHIMEWLERNKYNSGKNNIWLDGELRKDNPDLWGKNMETFNKWKQTTEAEPAMELLKKLKLEARKAD